MKTQIFICVVICLLNVPLEKSNAQTPVFSKGSVSFTAGYGLGSMWMLTRDMTFDDVVVSSTASTPSATGPFYGKFEVGAAKHLGLGIHYAYASNSWNCDKTPYAYGDEEEVTYHYNMTRITWSIMAHMNIHIGPFSKWDPYTGFGIGYRNNYVKYTSDNPKEQSGFSDPTVFHVGLEFGAGCRYYFTPNIAAYAEIGVAKSIFQTGITLNIPNKHLNTK